MRLFIIFTLFSSILSANCDMNYPPSTIASKIHKDKLKSSIALINKTKTGKILKPYIDELMQLDKIKLLSLEAGHHGESGEGCVIKAGEYFYEGFFIQLNEQLSTTELASSLVHEISHYKMLKQIITSNHQYPTKVSAFEISAFSAQYKFMNELEQLKLAERQLMFSSESQIIMDIMQGAYKLEQAWSLANYNNVINQLIAYGYPFSELNRAISQRSEKECVGKVDSPAEIKTGNAK